MRLAPLRLTARCLSEAAVISTTTGTSSSTTARTTLNRIIRSPTALQTPAHPRHASARTSKCSRPRRRSYHSYDHPPPPAPFGDVEEAILAAAHRHVPDHGFSERALGLGARDAGYLDISPAVFPDPAFSLIRYHLVTRRTALAAQSREILGDHPYDEPRVAANVAALTWARLLENRDIIHRWQEALAIMAQPTYLPESLRELASLSDEICFLAGDEAVDPSWYAKRAALSMVFSSSELFMTNDRSPGFIETNRFMQRRLDESQLLGGAIASIGQFAGFTFSAGLNALRSKGVPI